MDKRIKWEVGTKWWQTQKMQSNGEVVLAGWLKDRRTHLRLRQDTKARMEMTVL